MKGACEQGRRHVGPLVKSHADVCANKRKRRFDSYFFLGNAFADSLVSRVAKGCPLEPTMAVVQLNQERRSADCHERMLVVLHHVLTNHVRRVCDAVMPSKQRLVKIFGELVAFALVKCGRSCIT